MTGVSMVLCTAPVPEAATLADTLLAERLVACVNLLGPVESRYRWQGKVDTSRETILLMKTTSELVERLRARIAELHSYEVPEVLEVRADSGLAAYLGWVADACR
jgi:periplasmic divalent cation tolerance protein